VLSLIVLFTLIGCHGNDSKLVGTWQTNMEGAHSEYHFFSDGHFTMQTHMGADVASVEGNAQVDSGRLVLTPSKTDVQGPDPQIADQMRQSIGQSARVPMRWDNPMSFTLSMNDGTPGLIFNRMSDKP